MAVNAASPETVRRMVDRIVERFSPEKVIVFGSWAHGEAGPDSDVDFLVVMRFSGSRLKLGVEIRRTLFGFGVPKDVIVLTPEEFEQGKDTPGTTAYPAAHDGCVLYAA